MLIDVIIQVSQGFLMNEYVLNCPGRGGLPAVV